MDEVAKAVLDVVPSRAKFVARYVACTTFSSVSIGLVCGQLGAMLSNGPLIPFLSGAWLGYSISCISFMRYEMRRAREYIRKTRSCWSTRSRSSLGRTRGLTGRTNRSGRGRSIAEE
jgi:hypothetical protein